MNRTIGYIAFGLLLILVIFMGWATWEEHLKGTEYAMNTFYKTPWFNLLWTWTALTGGYYMLKQKLFRKISVFLLHASLLIILLGAFVTRFNGKTGMVYLRENTESKTFHGGEGQGNVRLPFSLLLKSFRIEYYPGTSSPSNYVSIVEVYDNEKNKRFEKEISMNNILKYRGYRFYQSSFDEDMKGSALSVNHDSTGIAITYTGYFLLFFSVIWVLLDRKGRFIELLGKLTAKKVEVQ